MKQGPTKLNNDVIDALNQELSYQDQMSGFGRADYIDHGVAAQLVTLSVYSDKANQAWVGSNNEISALDNLRKCAAIAVRALIHYGCPKRSDTQT